MKSISRKIILLGDFAVGKTSTVARSVRNTFSDTYLTTVGVRVDSKAMAIDDDLHLRMVLWDIAGANTLDQLRSNYVMGAQGILLVADGTREDTVDTALELREQAWRLLGREVPVVLMLNKSDLADAWAISQDRIRELQAQLPTFTASAKTATGVEEAFAALARELLP
ncbi:Rab family GTPase [Solilutibacter silvestris]|uniref:Small GTP-binding protein n=1 Tax=Solilutibacter silvestris TaxID=1645665 RepID=A0A2K1Q177_9GAMM|nr:Rab family GTPase [Lysobacter silvestris]PNS08798.1 small GTP-binding protein [Lysobacter silvestris]